ncbi:MAG: hypothetical protein M1816_002266 [Peltula sp. TS41687]|nr:MAG: hypothetical protein M1816_002266 [Peltula sp. TS41687]
MSSRKPKVLLLGQIVHAHKEWQALADIAELIKPKGPTREDFLEQCRSGDLDGVVATYRTFESIDITGRFDEELIAALPESLKFICHNGRETGKNQPANGEPEAGAGYDQVDVHACTARGIRVSNVPTAVNDATADTNMFLIIGALRGFNYGMQALREGKWRGRPFPPLGHDPEGKTLGIVGMGGIGRNLRDKAEAFGMKIQYYNRRRLDDDLAGRARYVEFKELLRTSDVISLNLPLNDKNRQGNTRHLISKPEFEKMKDGVVIVNTARGAIMDESALVEALNTGKVFSCGLDVYEDEPKVHPGLIGHPQAMLVPHMGTWTVETQEAMETWNINNVRSALETGKLKSPVSEQAEME